MLNELVAYGSHHVRKPEDSNALKEEKIGTDLIIDAQGNFKTFVIHDKKQQKNTKAEALSSKKGKARLLLDKVEETLELEAKKHELYLTKLNEYKDVSSIHPVLLFYNENKEAGLNAAKLYFEALPEKQKDLGNIAFLLSGDDGSLKRIHEQADVIQAIIERFEQGQQSKQTTKLCSICGKADHPVVAEPHGMIKRVPDGQMSGCAFVSYNKNAYESYGFKGNENSSICTACARNYVEGLNYLLNNGVPEIKEDAKGKPKEYFKYSNRKNLASDTAMIYWTRSNANVQEIEYLDNPEDNRDDIEAFFSQPQPSFNSVPNAEAVGLIINSPWSAKEQSLKSVDVDRFYSCILSGAAARIAVRTWIETNTSDLRANIKTWFEDIRIEDYDFDTKEQKKKLFSIRELANCCCVHRKDSSEFYKLDKKDDFIGRASNTLWQCALTNKMPPKTLLDRILRRIRMEEGNVTPARVALLKLILNRRREKGEVCKMKEKLDTDNTNVAYNAGRIFAVLERVQSAALGKELNAPIRDRFFSAASTTPSATFGRLFKMASHHLAKLRGEKPGFAFNLDKDLGEICLNIKEFPAIFSLEDQGRFAIGYYHQKQAQFSKKDADNAETTTTKE
ncbi:type I-C CRISPR-associated protein Cas8c/Csd1 [Desulfovibrio litoralis]|uniref:CRISPR-associated protein Csd1 n=1 Tax=Desulfovibrio litoralis DSM 11393 TaxID=1121455 RepID=A0A1M7TR62_9BACT|nr:type I-C CRISPR-associated protein Cas8c/Csd1 [Desulfovibrio litoralis]SHN73239.1 CRISPR-associated protein Csd1 [Desulfovibrio litoralis DSM 11393]